MTEKKPGDLMMPPSGGVMREFVNRLKLIARLMGDSRVNILLKILPVATIAYLIWPVDLLSVVPGLSALDDIAIVSLGNYLFVELCPPSVVQEHLKALSGGATPPPDTGEVVDAEVKDLPNDK
jgi:uncharacterized membrane protein YkvA (DUF1232 family)